MHTIPGFREVRLYYPNTWRKYIGDLAPEEDKRFNWFLCSQRYQDPKTKLYLAEISKTARFYDEKTGDTLTLVKDRQAKILIIDDPENESLRLKAADEIARLIRKNKYQGYAYLQKCTAKRPDQLVVCREAVFGFDRDLLEPPKKDDCAIIEYAKRNNTCLRAAIVGFPSLEEIESSLKKYSKSDVCKALYQDIMEYMNG